MIKIVTIFEIRQNRISIRANYHPFFLSKKLEQVHDQIIWLIINESKLEPLYMYVCMYKWSIFLTSLTQPSTKSIRVNHKVYNHQLANNTRQLGATKIETEPRKCLNEKTERNGKNSLNNYGRINILD